MADQSKIQEQLQEKHLLTQQIAFAETLKQQQAEQDRKVQESIDAAQAQQEKLAQDKLRAQLKQNSKLQKETSTLTLDRELSEQQKQSLNPETKSAQDQLAQIIDSSSPVTTALAYKVHEQTPNTPQGNKSAFEKSVSTPGINQTATDERTQTIFDAYGLTDTNARQKIINDQKELSLALETIGSQSKGVTRDEIDATNNALIDFHRTVQKTATSSLNTSNDGTQEAQEQARITAKKIADDITASTIHQNRQREYLRHLDNLRRQHDDRENQIKTKKEIEDNARVRNENNVENLRGVNLTQEAQALLAQKHEQKQFELGHGGPNDNNPNDPNFKKPDDNSSSVGFEQVPAEPQNNTLGHQYAGIAMYDEDGRPSDNHTDIRVLGSQTTQEAKNLGIDKGDNARDVTVVQNSEGVNTVGRGTQFAQMDRTLERRINPANNH